MLPTLLCLALAAPPTAPPPRVVVRPADPPDLADWTPRPATGKAEPWEKATDKDWIDPRFRTMQTGPFLNCTLDYPAGRGKERVYKATAIKLGDGGVVFDRCTMRLAAGWSGGWLNHSDRRFGLINTPTPKGDPVFATPPGAGWADRNGKWETGAKKDTAPLPADWVRYRGLYVHGDRAVLSYRVGATDVLDVFDHAAGRTAAITRHLSVGPGKATLRLAVPVGVRVAGLADPAPVPVDRVLTLPPSDRTRDFRIVYGTGPAAAALDLAGLTKPGPKRWGEPLVTKLERGTERGPFAVDTLTLPYQNPFGALFFCTGLDFLPDGRVAVCTCHGDVWLAKPDEAAGTVSWQRFATGLYHPLGLKVVAGKVVVLERGQLTRLHDDNGDGEADFYECVSNAWHTGGGEHSYDTCLETDAAGNFYFFKTGDTDTPSGGTLVKVAKDGSKAETFATGFRHPIGMGMSPTGVLTGADQEGNWMPATRIDEYRAGGFYGDMRAHHRTTPPKLFDGPLCWVPREVDNSAGGQVWVPEGAFGPLAGLPLHFSYGRCRPFVLLRQETTGGVVQGGVAALDVDFLSGVCRGRFHPADGHLYVCGLNGWQTAAKADGCVQRVRATGKPLDVPVALAVDGDTIRLTFSRPLDPTAGGDPDRYRSAWWNYRWSGDYGSKRYSVADPAAEGQDDVPVRRAKVLADGRTVELTFDGLRPVMQMQVGYNLLAADGRKVVGSVFLTIHTTGK